MSVFQCKPLRRRSVFQEPAPRRFDRRSLPSASDRLTYLIDTFLLAPILLRIRPGLRLKGKENSEIPLKGNSGEKNHLEAAGVQGYFSR